MPLQSGSILNDRYRILSVLGKGGFGAVYRAADMSLKCPCAVKENLDTSPEAFRQFEKEATILANLSHPNLPRVLDHFLIQGMGQYLVMDFIEGMDLRSLVERDGPVKNELALDWIGQIASALSYLHQQNPPVIHRDIKPANIRVRPDGKAFLVDFGLVKIYSPHLRTTIGARAVTPGYSPPEQYGQGNTDPRTDIYALAATLYTLLTGMEPQESVQRIVQDQLAPLDTIHLDFDAGFGQVISRAMSLNPSQRYATVLSFDSALKTPPVLVAAPKTQISQPTQPYTHPEISSPDVPKSLIRRPWFWLVVFVGLIGIVFLFFRGDDESPPSRELTSKPVVVVQAESTEQLPISTEQPDDKANEPTTSIPRPTYTLPSIFTDIPPTLTPKPATNTLEPPTSSPTPLEPEFTASEIMFCRDGPGPEYEDHTMVNSGETVPVLAKWSNGWFLVEIDNPNTRTKCCWVGGNGYLNVSVSSIQTITYFVDRITCQPR